MITRIVAAGIWKRLLTKISYYQETTYWEGRIEFRVILEQYIIYVSCILAWEKSADKG